MQVSVYDRFYKTALHASSILGSVGDHTDFFFTLKYKILVSFLKLCLDGFLIFSRKNVFFSFVKQTNEDRTIRWARLKLQ